MQGGWTMPELYSYQSPSRKRPSVAYTNSLWGKIEESICRDCEEQKVQDGLTVQDEIEYDGSNGERILELLTEQIALSEGQSSKFVHREIDNIRYLYNFLALDEPQQNAITVIVPVLNAAVEILDKDLEFEYQALNEWKNDNSSIRGNVDILDNAVKKIQYGRNEYGQVDGTYNERLNTLNSFRLLYKESIPPAVTGCFFADMDTLEINLKRYIGDIEHIVEEAASIDAKRLPSGRLIGINRSPELQGNFRNAVYQAKFQSQTLFRVPSRGTPSKSHNATASCKVSR